MAEGFRTHNEGLAEAATAADAYAVDRVRPALQRALTNPDARAVIQSLVANGLYDLIKLGVGIYVTVKVATGTPLIQIDCHHHFAPVAAQVEQPSQPPPPGTVCLPSREPLKK
jgi:hypothetical protein